MVDKKSLRSSKPDSTSSSSTNGDKSKAAPTKAAPTRTASTRSKPAPTAAKRASVSKGAGDDPPHTNGVEPVENGINGDVEMGDEASDAADKSQPHKDKDGDDEMTVVVPPPKASKSSLDDNKDREGDVAMDGVDQTDGAQEEERIDPVAQTISDIKSNFPLLERAVAQFDARFSLRVLRSISSIRKRLTPDILAQVITDTHPASSSHAKTLLAAIAKEGATFPSAMEVDSDSKTQAATSPNKSSTVKEPLPEVDIYLAILVQIHLHDSNQMEAGANFSTTLVQKIHALNRRTLDSLSARVYFYYSVFHEHLAPLPPSPMSPVVSIRQQLLAALRTAVLRKDTDTQASVTTLLLRNYLSTSHISQADLLVSHTQFPPAASNNQIARYLYYLGRIRAIQLSYTEAQEHLTGATRKSPSSASAAGFYQASMKLLIVVELLMGDIPDRAVFRQPSLERALQPYFLLVQGVRVGDLEGFLHTVQTHSSTFRRDGTYTLILRLRQNVIKTGIRMMSLSYSRISLRDICVRLSLDSEESAEYIVAKAIRDGVIEATLDHENGFMKSKELGDIYATREPGEAFHDRIRACLGLHDESVKAMRFPMNQHRLELKNAQEARERERELAKEIQEGDIDEDDAGGDFEGMIDVSTRLRRAIHLNDLLLVSRIIRTHPRSIQNVDVADKGNSSLHLAARLGRVKIVECLFAAGHEAAGISRNAEHATPLMSACCPSPADPARASAATDEQARLLVVQALLAAGFARCVPWRDRAGVDALMLAARHGFPSIAARLLEEPLADPNACDLQGNTALHYASAYGELKVLRILLMGGARPDVRNWASWTPVSYSATVQAEVYFKGLVAEWERWERNASDRGAGGVRLVRPEDDAVDEIHGRERGGSGGGAALRARAGSGD